MLGLATKVRTIIAEKLGLEVTESDIPLDADLQIDLGADEYDIIEIAYEFEKEFNIPISEEQLETLKTIGQIIAYLEKTPQSYALSNISKWFTNNKK